MAEDKPIDILQAPETKTERLVGVATRFFKTRVEARESWENSVSSQQEKSLLIGKFDSRYGGEVVADLAHWQPQPPETEEKREYHFFPSDQGEKKDDAALYQEIFDKQAGELGEEGGKLLGLLTELWQEGFYFGIPYSLFRHDTIINGVKHLLEDKAKSLSFITGKSGNIRLSGKFRDSQFLNEAGVDELTDKLGMIIKQGTDFAAEWSRDDVARLEKLISCLPEVDCVKLRAILSYFTAGVRAYTDIEAGQLAEIIDERSVMTSLTGDEIKDFFGQIASLESYPDDVGNLYQRARSMWRESFRIHDPNSLDFLTTLAVSQSVMAADRIEGDLRSNIELLLRKLGFGRIVEKTLERRKLGIIKSRKTVEEFVLEDSEKETLGNLSVKDIVSRLLKPLEPLPDL